MSLPTSVSNSEINHVPWTKRLKTSLYHCIPILSWMPFYNADKFICDLIAGVTVGLTVIPQSLAYATLAGLEPQVCGNFLLNFMVYLFVLIYHTKA
jgi:sodium-independent sulfate anion transporter 11